MSKAAIMNHFPASAASRSREGRSCHCRICPRVEVSSRPFSARRALPLSSTTGVHRLTHERDGVAAPARLCRDRLSRLLYRLWEPWVAPENLRVVEETRPVFPSLDFIENVRPHAGFRDSCDRVGAISEGDHFGSGAPSWRQIFRANRSAISV